MNQNNKSGIKTYILSVIAMLIVTPIFVASFGSSLLYDKSFSDSKINDYQFIDESRLIYLVSTIISQIIHPALSKISGGFILLPIFESMLSSASINYSCTKYKDIGFVNTLLCLWISCIVSSFLHFILWTVNAGKILKMIPANIINSMMLKTGIELLLFGCKDYFTENLKFSFLFIAVSLIITSFSLTLLKKYNSPNIVIGIILFLYLIMNIIRTSASEFLYEHKLFLYKQCNKMDINGIYSKISASEIDLNLVFKNWNNILSLAIYPLIRFSINIPSYASMINITVDMNKELLFSTFSSLLSSVSCFPSAINCSGSVFLYYIGAHTRFHGVIVGISLIVLYFCFHEIIVVTPTFVISLITQIIGISFLLEYGLNLFKISKLDKLNVLILLIVSFVSGGNTMLVIALGLIINIMMSFLILKRFIFTNCLIECNEDETCIHIKLREKCDFTNILDVSNKLNGCNKNVLLDLTECNYVDMTANQELLNLIILFEEKGKYFKIKGNPANFYTRSSVSDIEHFDK